MIKVYENGNQLLEENKSFLDSDMYNAVFFYLDCPLLKESSKENYALKVENGNEQLLALKVEPYNMLLFGSPNCVHELVDFLIHNEYQIKGLLAPKYIGDEMLKELSIYGYKYKVLIAMDLMECKEKTLPSASYLEIPTIDDLDELCELHKQFIIDCGLNDEVYPEKIKATLSSYLIVRKDGKIVSMAKCGPSTIKDIRIACVYTRPEYRGKHYARDIVNTLKNNIIDQGMIATLNVDEKNPISNHIYSSIGFKILFTHCIYEKEEN